MSTIDTSTWNPDADLNTEIEGIPLNADAGIAQTWQALRILMAGVAGDGDTLATAIAYALAVAQGRLIGPSSATDGHIAVFDGTSGIQLRDSGMSAGDIATAPFSGATVSAGGASGLVPAPQAGDESKVLRGDGTWAAASSVAWVDVADKPSTFPPSSHTHGSITSDGKLGTASRVVVTDGSKVVGVSRVTSTELGYLSGATSAVQTQLNRKLEAADLCNWQMTEKAASVSFYPVPNAALEPFVEFMFTETPPASGEKGAENPSVITGISSVTLTHCEVAGVDETSYAVSLGATFYGGTIDVAAGSVVANIGATILDETYNFGTTNGYLTEYSGFYGIVFYPGCAPYSSGYLIPSAFTSNRLPIAFRTGSWQPSQNCIALSSGSRGAILCLSKTALSLGDGENIATVRTAMLQWLSTHPITMTCPLENPLSVSITPFQILSLNQASKYASRKNTIYTNIANVQVGYQRFYDENRFAEIESRLASLEEALNA